MCNQEIPMFMLNKLASNPLTPGTNPNIPNTTPIHPSHMLYTLPSPLVPCHIPKAAAIRCNTLCNTFTPNIPSMLLVKNPQRPTSDKTIPRINA